MAALELREYPVPDTGAGEALIRVEMAGVCGTDVHLCEGELNIPLPIILGHETVGRIEKLGPGLESWGFEPRHVHKALALLENPHWQQRFASEITHRYPLAQATEAVDNARQARGGITVLVL